MAMSRTDTVSRGLRYFMKSMVPRGLKNSMESPDLQGLDAHAAHHQVEQEARAEHAGEQRSNDADHQRDREALDGTRAVLEEHDAGDERGDLAIEDGPERTV